MKPAACWMAVHLPALSIESFAATLGPEQAHRPLALLEGPQIVAVDARASEAGVRPGQRRATALALEPGLLLGRADPLRDRQALRAVAWAALQFSPCVTEQAPHTVLLEVAATTRLFGGLDRLTERLCETLKPLRHQVRLACAPTAWGAALLALWEGWEGWEGSDRQELRKVAEGLDASPDRPFGIGPHTSNLQALRDVLDKVPLTLLCTQTSQWEALQGMGLQRVGDLRALPRQGLARRFGPALLQRLDQARGDAPDPREGLSLPATFQARLELFARADTTEQVLHGAELLLARLVHWAQARQARVSRFTLEMAHERRHRPDDSTPARSALPIALAQPCADVTHLRALLRERLARTPLPAPTLELHLRCDELAHAAPPDGELFPTRARAQEGLARLVEHLQARLGAERVHGLGPVADHRPERGVGQQTPRPPSSSSRASGAPALPHLTRPAWLLPVPRPLPEHRGRPLWEGQPLRLLAGPERIEAGWWDGPAAARDYFVAGTPAGVLVWIYRTRLPQPGSPEGWALQGWFG